jgi:hypothetical protein
MTTLVTAKAKRAGPSIAPKISCIIGLLRSAGIGQSALIAFLRRLSSEGDGLDHKPLCMWGDFDNEPPDPPAILGLIERSPPAQALVDCRYRFRFFRDGIVTSPPVILGIRLPFPSGRGIVPVSAYLAPLLSHRESRPIVPLAGPS